MVSWAPACAERCADEGELIFMLAKHGAIIPNPGRSVKDSFRTPPSSITVGKDVGLVDQVAEGALQLQALAGEGAAGAIRWV